MNRRAGAIRSLPSNRTGNQMEPPNVHCFMEIIPAGPTIADLEKKAAKYEEKARMESVQIGNVLMEKAKLCRDWVGWLKSGNWMS
jgi:hypothetical protein